MKLDQPPQYQALQRSHAIWICIHKNVIKVSLVMTQEPMSMQENQHKKNSLCSQEKKQTIVCTGNIEHLPATLPSNLKHCSYQWDIMWFSRCMMNVITEVLIQSTKDYMSSILVTLKCKHAHLKFTIYGRKQASKHTHTSANAITLVWGLLRLAQINISH